MEAEFDSIDTNEGGMILFQEFTNWAFSKNFDLEDDIDSQAEVALLNLLNRTKYDHFLFRMKTRMGNDANIFGSYLVYI